MNEWLIAALVLMAPLAVCVLVAAISSAVDGVVALQLGGVLAALVLLLVAEGLERQPLADLALVTAALSFAGTLAFVRFLERRL